MYLGLFRLRTEGWLVRLFCVLSPFTPPSYSPLKLRGMRGVSLKLIWAEGGE